jgi:hypothetical protein
MPANKKQPCQMLANKKQSCQMPANKKQSCQIPANKKQYYQSHRYNPTKAYLDGFSLELEGSGDKAAIRGPQFQAEMHLHNLLHLRYGTF